VSEERRLVTVLFADVTGSTAMGESLDPEDMRALLARYFAIARETVTAHGGTLEKFIGDAVMAVFGLPSAHDDDAGRAVAAAIALRDQVHDDPTLGDRLPIRLGLSTGEVVASVDASAGDFLVTGDAVNVAARLQQGADSWEIICGERTARAAGDRFAFGPVLELEVRGKGAHVRGRRVEGTAPARPRPRVPFLGRDADVAQLDLTAARVVRERRPFMVTITAPAGTGKTRLLEEFLERLSEHHPEARAITAQCLPYGQRLTYWPLRALLLQLLDLPDDPDPEMLRPAAEAWLRGVGETSPRRSAELLAATFGTAEGDPIDRSELFGAWRSAIELAARRQPLLLVIEDLHWSADSLLDLIEVVLQPRGEAALMMIVLARPELLDRRPTWGGGRRNYVSVALEPLDDDSIAALVEHLLEGPSADIVRAVVERAEGNPFYAGELARSISERVAALEDPGEAARIVARLPDTVHATVLARLDLLPAGPRRVLQLGAVFGRSFATAGVQSLDSELPEVEGAIELLLGHDLVRPTGVGELAFRHILIREVAYQTLPRADRARLHASAGRWLEVGTAGREEEHAELVAFHFREATTLLSSMGTDPEPGLVDSAVRWLRRAAAAAAAGAAYDESARHLRAAIEFAPREELPELWADLGDRYGGGNLATDAYATAARLGRELGRAPDFILRALSGRLMVLGRWAGSVATQLDDAELEMLRDEIRDTRGTSSDLRAIGYSLVAESFLPFGLLAAGDHAYGDEHRMAALEPAEQAIDIGRKLDDPVLLSAALDAKAALFLGVDPVLGLELTRERLAISDRLPLYEKTDVHNMLAWNSAALGQLGDVHAAVVDILRDLAPNQAQATALSLAAWELWSLALLGRWDELTAAAERAIRRWEDSGRLSAGFALHGYMAALEVGWARRDERLVPRMQQMILGITEQFQARNLFRRLAAFAAPNLESLVDDVIGDWLTYVTRNHVMERVLSLCVDRRQQMPPSVLDVLIEEAMKRKQRLLLAQALRARGVQRGDAASLQVALGMFRAFGAWPMVGRVEVELGQLTDDAALTASGTATLEQLGDIEQLARYAALAR
jgi:class 3 adenylate cyclase